MESKPQLPCKKRKTEAENDSLFQKLNDELKVAPAFTSGITEWMKQIEERLTDLEFYCYETIEVGKISCWDPSKCTPRENQIQKEVAIWRMMNPLKKTIEEIKKRVDKRSNNIGTKENPIIIN